MANAETNFGLDKNNLYIKDIIVNEKTKMKRWLPRAHGRASLLLKRTCSVEIILDERVKGKGRKKVVKQEIKDVKDIKDIKEIDPEEKIGKKKKLKEEKKEVVKEKSRKNLSMRRKKRPNQKDFFGKDVFRIENQCNLMGHKVNPQGIRIGITSDWKSRWFSKKDFASQLKEDIKIRELIFKQLKNAAVGGVEVERSVGSVRIIIKTARPGIIIGRGGTGVEDIKKTIKDKFFKQKKLNLKVEVEEIKNMEENAMVIAQSVAEQLEKRMPFRRVLKTTLERMMENKRINGIKIEISGRLGGADMSRREWSAKGNLPLHTLRADIDFAKVIAMTTFGVIGVKVWVNRGEKF